MQPTTSHHLHCPEPQSLEPVPKKPRTEQMEGPFPDFKDTKFPEELEEPCDASNQVGKGCFNYVAERRFDFHENWGSPGSPEGVVATWLQFIYLR